MSVTYMLDTNMVSYIVTGKSPAARAKMAKLRGDNLVCVSVITEAEIKYGLAKRSPSIKVRNSLEGFLASVEILPWGRDQADAYGLIRAKLEVAGKTLESMDLMIAAHAVSLDAVLVTSDKVFRQVNDLSASVDWTTELHS